MKFIFTVLLEINNNTFVYIIIIIHDEKYYHERLKCLPFIYAGVEIYTTLINFAQFTLSRYEKINCALIL